MSDTDAIDSKKDKNNKEDNTTQDNTKKENNWSTFGYSCIFAIVLAIITWLMASNIVYFVRLPQEMLNKIFPKDPKKPPYAPPDDYVQTKKCTRRSTVIIDGQEQSVWDVAKDLKVIMYDGSSKTSRPNTGAKPVINDAVSAATNLLNNPTAENLAKPGADQLRNMLGGGKGIMENITNKIKDTTSKYAFPYTWMYPYSDCAPDATKDTQSKFYMGDVKIDDGTNKASSIFTDALPHNNSVYNTNGKINDPTIINQPEIWAGRTSIIQGAIKKLMSDQKQQINEAKKEKEKNGGNEENMKEMETNLKNLKALYAYFHPSIVSFKWWSQFGSNVGNWIASSTQYSFITERRLLQFIFKKLQFIFGNNEKAQSNDLADEESNSFAFGFFGMILSIVITYFITHFAMMAGAVVNAWGQISGTKYMSYSENEGFKKESNWGRGLKYSLIFGLMGFMNFMWSFGVGVVQYIEIIYKFIMYPIINNFDEWKTNITTTIQYLPLIYGMLITMAAWTSLEPLYGNVMFITLIVYLFKQNKAHNDAIKKAKQN